MQKGKKEKEQKKKEMRDQGASLVRIAGALFLILKLIPITSL